MEAATKNKYITPEDIVRQTGDKKRKGRPCAIPKDKIYILTNGMLAGKTWRQTTNNYYQGLGLGVIGTVTDNDEESLTLFQDGKRLKYCGVLEQLGRAGALFEKDKLTADELIDIAETAIELIKAGEKSKEVERRVRNIRRNLPLIRIWNAESQN